MVNNNGIRLLNSLEQNINTFRQLFKDNQTVIFREFENRININIKCCILYTDGMVNKELVDEHIIQSIMEMNLSANITPENIIDIFMKRVLVSSAVRKSTSIDDMVSSIAYGDTILLIDKVSEVLIIDTKGWPVRAIEEPPSEKVIKGPREGFTESIMSNLTMVRRRLKTTEFKAVFKDIGTHTKTKVCVCYIEGIVQDKILKELMQRLDKIDIDGILESQYIEEYIKDSPFSIFETVGNTESPNVAAAKLLEGKIVILCDGTPFVLTLPFLFIEYFHSYDDYYANYAFSSLNRLLRFLAFFLGLSVPAIYIGISTFQQELIPTSLLLSISAARKGIPLPTVVEAIVMLVFFDILREAGIRLPQPIGQTVSIVGALVLGEAAVNARFISAPMVIIVAATGICTFLVPKLLGAFMLIRMIFLLLSSLLGLYGYCFGVMGLFLYLFSLRSFGIPYMLYVSLGEAINSADSSIRLPWWQLNYRPRLIAKDKKRQKIT